MTTFILFLTFKICLYSRLQKERSKSRCHSAWGEETAFISFLRILNIMFSEADLLMSHCSRKLKARCISKHAGECPANSAVHCGNLHQSFIHMIYSQTHIFGSHINLRNTNRPCATYPTQSTRFCMGSKLLTVKKICILPYFKTWTTPTLPKNIYHMPTYKAVTLQEIDP